MTYLHRKGYIYDASKTEQNLRSKDMATIEAIYEKGVFRPTEKVEIEEGKKVKITIEITEVKKVSQEKDPAESILDLAIDTGIPDLATNIDHYLYGLPKQSE